MTDLVAHARTTDPITSHQAAASIKKDKVRLSQEAVLRVFKQFGAMTDQELLKKYAFCIDYCGWLIPQQSESGIRTRRSELVTKGLVVDSGEKSMLPTGRKAIIWKATNDNG